MNRRGENTNRLRAAALASVAVSMMPNAGAQQLEEITVTAQKREQSIQDVGIAITAFSGDQLDRLGLSDSTSIARLVPGVHLGGSSGGQTLQYTIRGVVQSDFSDHTESPVAVYIDDTYVAMSQAQRFALFDLERVEVLKGPQGTLFGRNATGGLVQFVTRKPTQKAEGYAEAEYGSFDRTRFEAAVSGGLSESISGRLSALWSGNNAYLENDFDAANPNAFFPSAALIAAGSGDDLGAERNVGVRGQLLIDMSEQAQLWLSANWADSKLSSPPYQTAATAPVIDAQGRLRNEIRLPTDSTAQAFSFETGAPIFTGVLGPFPRPVPGGDITGYIDPDGRKWDHSSANFAFDDLNRMETLGLSGKLSWQLSGASLTAISDYKDYSKRLGLDVDAAPMNQTAGFHVSDVEQWSQELRLDGGAGRLRWITGLYFLRVDYDYDSGFKILDNADLLLPPGTSPADYPSHVEQRTENASLFGQGELELSEDWTLVAGARVMREKKDFDYALQVRLLPSDPRDAFTGALLGVFSDIAGLPVPTATSQSTSDTLWTGKLQLEWRPKDDLLLYAGVSRGVKAGGFNAPTDFGATQLLPGFEYGYEPEELMSYEGGFKATLFGGTTRLNGAVYHYDYKDYQGFLFSGIGGVVVNNDATVNGAELEISTSPIRGLDVALSAAVTDAEVEDVELSAGISADREPAFTPPMTLSALVRYSWPVSGGEMAIQGDASYTDRLYYSLRNFDSHRLESYWLGNARVSWTSESGTWELAGLVNNVADKAYPTMGFGVSLFCGCSEVGVGRPRSWGLQVRRSF